MNRKKLSVIGMSTLMVLATSFGAFAADPGTSNEAVTAALTTVAADIIAGINAIAPIALSIAGVFLVWKYGMKFFKSVSK